MSEAGWSLLSESHDALRAVVGGVSADAWSLPTPCEQWNVAQVFQHATADQLAYAAKLTGGPGPDYDPFAPSGTIDGDTSTLLESALSTTANAFAAVDPDDAEVPVPLPPLKLAAPSTVADAIADPLRGFAFGSAITSEPGADAAASLLNVLGRRADWTR